MSSKKISFSIQDYVYNHFREFLDSQGLDYIRVDDLFKACAINRMITKGYLDEYGLPNPLCLKPKPDFSSLDISESQFVNKVDYYA